MFCSSQDETGDNQQTAESNGFRLQFLKKYLYTNKDL